MADAENDIRDELFSIEVSIRWIAFQ